MKFKINGLEALGPGLAEEINGMGSSIAQGVEARLKNVALAAKEKAAKWAATRLYRTKQQYLAALNVKQLGPGMWAIILDGDAAHLEEGYGSFDMKPGLLKLGQSDAKGVKVSKEGFRYRAIPFDHSQAPASDEHPLHNAVVQKGQENQTTMGNMAQDLKTLLKRTKLNGISKDANGNPILGKVATVRPDSSDPNQVLVTRHGPGGFSAKQGLGNSLGGSPNQLDPRLAGLTKYQYEEKKRDGTTRVRSAYMTFRMVSEKQQGKWIHPGFDGARIFPDLAVWAEDAIVKELEAYFQGVG